MERSLWTRLAMGALIMSVWTAGGQVPKPPVNPTSGNVLDIAFVKVPAGSFRMGSKGAFAAEGPVHDVLITRPFWIGKHEVTNGEYQAFLKASGYDGKPDGDGNYLAHYGEGQQHASTAADHPIVCVSWRNAAAFCRWLTEREREARRLPGGYEYRLPTEAEWEYAARGGASSRGFTYSGSNKARNVAWYDQNSEKKTHAVGQKKPNELGLHDMSGNVFEWCLDWYDRDYYKRSPGADPVNTTAAAVRAARGGSWAMPHGFVRSVYRVGFKPEEAMYVLGFRAVLAPQSGDQ